MPRLKVKIRKEADGMVGYGKGGLKRLTLENYRKLVVDEYGEENVSPVEGDSITVTVFMPTPVETDQIEFDGFDDLASVPVTDASMQKMAEDPEWFHIVSMQTRPGAYLFARMLELEHFRPGTPRNAVYFITTSKWAEQDWYVVTIPIQDRSTAEKVADEAGMRLANGIPMTLGEGMLRILGAQRPTPEFLAQGWKTFPMNSERVFTLENKPASMVYDGKTGAAMTHGAEMEAVQRLERKHSEWMRRNSPDIL